MKFIIGHRERHKDEPGFVSVATLGGARDGQEFRTVRAELNDGSFKWLFVSNTNSGYFKQVFVPWDFEHPDSIDS